MRKCIGRATTHKDPLLVVTTMKAVNLKAERKRKSFTNNVSATSKNHFLFQLFTASSSSLHFKFENFELELISQKVIYRHQIT